MNSSALNVQVCKTSSIEEQDFSAAEAAIAEVAGYLSIPWHVESMGETCDADSWVQKCLQETDRGIGKQVDAVQILKRQIGYTLARHAVDTGTMEMKKGLTLVLVHADVTDGWNDFLFGVSVEGIGSVVSVARLSAQSTDGTRTLVLRRLVCHEFGHALGLVPEARSTSVEHSIGLHCTNVCVMRQGLSLPQFTQLAIQEKEANIVFCSLCAEYLASDLRHITEAADGSVEGSANGP